MYYHVNKIFAWLLMGCFVLSVALNYKLGYENHFLKQDEQYNKDNVRWAAQWFLDATYSDATGDTTSTKFNFIQATEIDSVTVRYLLTDIDWPFKTFTIKDTIR